MKRGPNKFLLNWWLNGASPESEVEEPLAFGDDTVLFFDPARTKTMFKEINTSSASANNVGVPITEANTDDDLVGFVHDLSQHGLYMTNISGSSTRLTLQSDETRHSFWELDGTQWLAVQNSTGILRNFHKASPVFGIALWVKRAADGSTGYIFSSASAATQRGIEVRITTANKLSVLLADGDGGYMVNFASTPTILAADGWVPVRINSDGSNLAVTVGNNNEETSAISGGSANAATNNLSIGRRADNSSLYSGAIGQIIVNNTAITADQWTDWKAFNPERNTTSHINIVAREYDFTDITTCFTDVAGTSQVAADGSVASVSNSAMVSNFGSFNLNITQSTAGSRPTFRTNVQNGLSALEYDGTDDTLSIAQEPIRGGRFTWYFVFSNQDNTNGSHIFSGTADCYLVATGNDYDETSPRMVAHQGVGSSDENQGTSLTANSVNVIAFRFNGTEKTLFNMSGESSTDTNSLQFSPLNFGVTNNGDTAWNHDGYALLYRQVYGYETDAEITANINTLKTTFGL